MDPRAAQGQRQRLAARTAPTFGRFLTSVRVGNSALEVPDFSHRLGPGFRTLKDIVTISGSSLSFGPFDANLATGELRKNGVRIKLEQQPFQVLALLLQTPGQIVSREELKEALWADDTFVDFDNGLNTAIRKIRRALDDSATTPRYVETLPKRGYRFIAPVEGGAGAAADTSTEEPARVQSRLPWVVAAVVAVVAIVVAVFALHSPGTIATENRTEQPTIVPLTSLPGIEQHPTFSPDGSQVVFSWNGEDRKDFDIYVKPVFGGEPPHRLTDHPADDIMPAWSPDGQTIAFWRSNGNQSGVFLVSPRGGNKRKLFDGRPPIAGNRYDSSQLSWSPDGTRLAYTDTRKVSLPIRLFSLTTGEDEVLTEAAGGFDLFPAFSPDGSHVAWSRWMGSGSTGVFTMSLADRETKWRSEQASRGIAWTRDSQSLIISQPSMWRLGPLREFNLADGTERPVPNTSGAIYPATVRRGGHLAYAMPLLNLDVLRVDLAPGSFEFVAARKIFAATRLEMAPQISPDGSRVVFTSSRTVTRVWVGGADGSGLVDVASRAGIAARWSPDNRRIAFDGRTPRGTPGIYVVDADGGAPKLVTDPVNSASQPCWSEDGETLYFHSLQGGARRIWKKSASGEGQQTAVTQGFGQRCWVGSGWVYFTRGADIWRTPESEVGEEEMVLEGHLFEDSGWWQVREKILYFIDYAEGSLTGRWVLKRMDLSSGNIAELVELPQEPHRINGLSIAPDESWFVYVVDNTTQQDLMMMENFR